MQVKSPFARDSSRSQRRRTCSLVSESSKNQKKKAKSKRYYKLKGKNQPEFVAANKEINWPLFEKVYFEKNFENIAEEISSALSEPIELPPASTFAFNFNDPNLTLDSYMKIIYKRLFMIFQPNICEKNIVSINLKAFFPINSAEENYILNLKEAAKKGPIDYISFQNRLHQKSVAACTQKLEQLKQRALSLTARSDYEAES